MEDSMPRGADNESLILDAARESFTRDGYAATSMDAVSAKAGVSKATLYARFASKEELFTAMVMREGEELGITLERSPGRDIADELRTFALSATAFMLSEPVLGLHRLVAGEGDRSSLAEAFYRNGPDRLNRRLAAVLEEAMERGELRRSSPYLAATQFLAVIVGDLQLRALFRLAPPTDADRDATARAGAELFLQAYAPR
jgi:AcrR family transcriptional regulator